MKKWVICMMFCLCAGFLAAQTYTAKVGGVHVSESTVSRAVYTKTEIMQKVKNMEMLNRNRMPSSFWYLAGDEYLSDQDDINIFYMAKNRYEKNPNNFNAVFNYAVVILSLDAGEGCSCSDLQLDEAYRLLERAKKLNTHSLAVYRQQDFILMFKVFGPVWIGPGYTDEEAIDLYRNMPDLARKRLAVQEKLIAGGEGDLYTAWQISKALNRTESAAKYQQMIQKEQRAASAIVAKGIQEVMNKSR